MASRSSAPGCETKTSQDVSVGSKPVKSSAGGNSQTHRGSRRREPANGSLVSLNQQRPGGRARTGAGKRPPARGNNYQQHSQLGQADEFELGSIFNPGSKKHNYNHLLNFNYGSNRAASGGGRGGGRGGGGDVRRRGERGRRGDEVERRPRYDQSNYLQANCQFTVKAGEDYSLHLADPDTLVSWELIEEVELRTCSEEATACPVCLFPPVAGKMSRCGHVFCWACILHYLALSDDKDRPCPICHQDINKTDLRSVRVHTRHARNTGDIVSMTLMKRERNSVFAVPANRNFLADHPQTSQSSVDPDFVKMFIAAPDQVKANIIDRERKELEKQWEEEKDQPESCFIQEALKLLEQREVETLLRPQIKTVNPPPQLEPDVLPPVQSLEISSPEKESFVDPFADEDEKAVQEVKEDSARPRNESGVSSSGSEEGGEPGEEGVKVTDLDISTMQPSEPSAGQPRQVFYFYQSSDGQPIFLHALNVQMLVKQFGALENCPVNIEGRILEKEGAVMSDQLRDRLRYLKHLPITTNFEVAELDLSALVDKETFEIFRDQVESRKRKRNRKLKDEKRREKKIEEEEARMMGYPGRMLRVESDYFAADSKKLPPAETEQFPAFTSQDLQTSAGPTSSQTISFANVTRTKAAPVSQPTPPAPQSNTSWACLGSVKPVHSSRLVRRPEPEPEDRLEDSEDYVPPPQRASLGDTLAAALQAADSNQSKGKKGGKKGRGKTLLLTGGPPRAQM